MPLFDNTCEFLRNFIAQPFFIGVKNKAKMGPRCA